MVRVPSDREPTHPGEMLLEEFLKPMKISQRELTDRIHVPYQRVNELVNKRRGITPSTALRLALAFGNSACACYLIVFEVRSRQVATLALPPAPASRYQCGSDNYHRVSIDHC